MNLIVKDKEVYCLGYTHPKCDNCLNQKNWEDINELSDNDFQKAKLEVNYPSLKEGACEDTANSSSKIHPHTGPIVD